METLIKLIAEFDTYKETWYAVANKFMLMYKDLANNKDFFDTTAKIEWEYVDSLMNHGFTRDEAMMILFGKREILKSISENKKRNKV